MNGQRFGPATVGLRSGGYVLGRLNVQHVEVPGLCRVLKRCFVGGVSEPVVSPRIVLQRAIGVGAAIHANVREIWPRNIRGAAANSFQEAAVQASPSRPKFRILTFARPEDGCKSVRPAIG